MLVSAPVLQIIMSVFHYYFRGCVMLLYPRFNTSGSEEEALVFLQKRLSEENVMATVCELERFDHTLEEFRCRRQIPPLCVLLTDGSSTRTGLRALSAASRLDGPVWLLFAGSEQPTDLEAFFSDTYVPVNCVFLVAQPQGGGFLLTEVYRVSQHHVLQADAFGMWNPKTGAQFTEKVLYERRRDLQGLVLRGTGIEEPPLTVFKEDNGTLIASGFFGNLWTTLQRLLNFTTRLERAADNAYGSLDNGSWNGVIQMLQDKAVDVAVGEFRMTTERLDVIDYTRPISASRYNTYIRQPSVQKLIWSRFLSPFSPWLWISVVISIFVFAAIFMAVFQLNRRFIDPGNAEHQDLFVWDSLHFVYGAFCQQGQDFTPRSNSCRMMYWSMYVVGVVLVSAYSAALVSFLAKRRVDLPFSTLEELAKDGTYKFGVLQKSAEYSFFYHSDDKVMQKIYKKFIMPEKDSLPTSSHEGLSRICEGKFAYFLPYDIAREILADVPCEAVALPGDKFEGCVSIALSKNSPYREMINYDLLRLQVGGSVYRLRHLNWIRGDPEPSVPWITVGIKDVTPLLVVLATGVVASILLLGAEFTVHVLLQKYLHAPYPWTL